jgi:glucose-6-phosphate-specific signal transduction histidine kinase
MTTSDTLLSLCADVQRVADEQRRGFARRLHDSAQQTLAAASMSLALLERQATNLPPAARAALSEAMQIVATCNQELRDIAHDLHPPLLDGRGLAAALRGLRNRAGGDRLAFGFDELPRLTAARELTLFRLIEQALTWLFVGDGPVTVEIGPAGDLVMTGIGPARPEAREALKRMRFRALIEGGDLLASRSRGQLRLRAVFTRASKRRPAKRPRVGKVRRPLPKRGR